MEDDAALTRPVHAVRRQQLSKIAGLAGGIIIGALIALAGIWIALVDDPLGGEPVKIISLHNLDSPPAGRAARDASPRAERAARTDNGSAPGGDAPVQGTDFAASPARTAAGPDYDALGTAPGPLSTVADPRIAAEGLFGTLPVIAENGLRALDLYARPASQDLSDLPGIAIIVGDLGLSQTATKSAIDRLPPEVTLAFSPYGSSLDRWVGRARQKGHELLIELPLEPYDYPRNDPGPQTLLVTRGQDTQAGAQTMRENDEKLQRVLSRFTNYIGIVNESGGRFLASEPDITALLGSVRDRGLAFVDDGSTPRSRTTYAADTLQLPFAKADIAIDETAHVSDIASRLVQLEALARSSGFAVASARNLPVSIDQIVRWAEGLEARGIRLVPVSAVIAARFDARSIARAADFDGDASPGDAQ